MLRHLTQFYRPQTVQEACTLLEDKTRKNVPLAGGTYLTQIDDATIDGLVDLKGLQLSSIRADNGGFRIGAMTPVFDIATSTVLTGPAGTLLREAAKRIGSTPLRHSITAGGNLVGVFPWSDLPPALLVLEAEVTLANAHRKRTIPLTTLYATRPNDVIERGEIMTEIFVPAMPAGSKNGTSFIKMAKTANDYAIITVATRLTFNGGIISAARIAINAPTRKPTRCRDAEDSLKGKQITPELLTEAGVRAISGIEFTPDFRASKEYRMDVLPVVVRRALEQAAKANA